MYWLSSCCCICFLKFVFIFQFYSPFFMWYVYAMFCLCVLFSHIIMAHLFCLSHVYMYEDRGKHIHTYVMKSIFVMKGIIFHEQLLINDRHNLCSWKVWLLMIMKTIFQWQVHFFHDRYIFSWHTFEIRKLILHSEISVFIKTLSSSNVVFMQSVFCLWMCFAEYLFFHEKIFFVEKLCYSLIRVLICLFHFLFLVKIWIV